MLFIISHLVCDHCLANEYAFFFAFFSIKREANARIWTGLAEDQNHCTNNIDVSNVIRVQSISASSDDTIDIISIGDDDHTECFLHQG